jgi:Flp pilus assembly protein TadG
MRIRAFGRKEAAGHVSSRSIGNCFRNLCGDLAGGVAVVLALSFSAVVGFAGIGTEAASWYLTKRAMQGAADAAASTAAAALAAGASSASLLTTQAKSIAAANKFADAANGVAVRVNYPPASGDYQSSPAVEVLISQPQPGLISSMFLPNPPTISVRAVALANFSLTGEACVVALDIVSETSTVTSGSTDLEFPGCSLYINSPSPIALNMNGGTLIHPNIAYLVGNYTGGGLTAVNGVYLGVDPLIDPYRNAAVPPYSGCDSNNYRLTGGRSETKNVTASGVYVFCNGLELTGNSSLTLGAGTFIIDRGQLSIQGGSILTATSGTTIILTTSDPSKTCALAKINGGALLTLNAPSSGNLRGIAMYQDRACNNHLLTSDVNGGATQNITGAIYFPEQNVNYAGGSPTGGAQCTQLVAWKINFTGSSSFQNNCNGTGIRALSLTGGRLVE